MEYHDFVNVLEAIAFAKSLGTNVKLSRVDSKTTTPQASSVKESIAFQPIIKCENCKGTGNWPSAKNPNAKHFACKGTGQITLNPMSKKQRGLLWAKLLELKALGAIDTHEYTEEWAAVLYDFDKRGIVRWSSKEASNRINELMDRIKRAKS